MKDLVSPKQVARALQVSESSVKRWCDRGTIPTRYTAGGHRRIPIADLLAFLRTQKYELFQPEALGLPATSGKTLRVIERATTQLTESLLAGDENQCRQIALDLYLAEHSISTICDEFIAKAFTNIGDRWSCGEAEVYQERRGCEIAFRILHELRSLIPAPAKGAPLAIGTTPPGDHYGLGSMMAELVLRDANWNAESLGVNLPFDTIAAAIREQHPKLFWLSCSHITNEASFLAGYRGLYEEHGMNVAFVVGGQALTEAIRQHMKYSAFCDNMQRLDALAQTLRRAIETQR